MSLRSLALLAVAMIGCRIEKPATVVPSPPTIDNFKSSAASVKAGGTVTLSWQTSNATSVELQKASGGDLGVSADTLSGNIEVTIDAPSLFVLVARGPGGSDARAVSVTVSGEQVGAVSFQALPPIIPAGGSSTLAWTAPGASVVTLTAGGQPVDIGGQRNSGAVTVTPQFDTTYTLTADTETKTVDVVVQPGVLSAEVTPRAAEVGETVTVRWTAAGGTRLVLSSPGRGQLFETTMASAIAAGSFDDVVPAGPAFGLVTYEITLEKGTERFTRTVELNVGSGLAITRFEAPPTAAAGASYLVRWQTRSADEVELQIDGVSVFRTTAATEVANGLHAFTAPTSDFAIKLIARNARGAEDSQLFQVDAVGIPTSATLTANPTTVAAGQPVTLTYTAADARRARIVDADGIAVFSVTGQAAESGSVMVYPSVTTTYTLKADNLLGNPAVTATAPVTVTGTPTAVNQFPPTALSGQMVDLQSPTAELLAGFPHSQVLAATQADFRDISTTGARVLEMPSNVTTIDPPFSTFLWGTKQTGSLTISRAGWMAWGAPVVVNSSNATSLPSTSGAPGLIAPFWDDLTLIAGSAVYWQIVGDAPEETLIVQWDKLQVGSTSGTQVTFQVQVHQRGTVSFQYKTVNLPSSPSYLVGIQDPTTQLGVRPSGAPTTNSAFYFFSPVTPPAHVQVRKGAKWGGFVKVGNSWSLVSQTALAVVVPTDLALTEVMYRPNANVPSGQYIEVINLTAAPLDMTGWALAAAGTPSFAVPSGFLLQPNVFTVIGASTDPALNDDAGVNLAWGGFSLAQDGGTLNLGTADAGTSYAYPPAGVDAGATGQSIDIDFGPFTTTSTSNVAIGCSSKTPFGTQTPQQLGTPGARGYCIAQVQSITPHFVDISSTGTRLINSQGSTVDGRTVPITLAATGTDPAPVAFGVRQPVVSMSIDGWMVWGTVTDTDFVNVSTTSTSSTMKGKLAIFWDDLETFTNLTPPSDLFWKQFAPNEDPATPARHWVFQWARVRHWTTTSTATDDLNFEIKLFEDGTIEYHYGSMTSGTSSNYANGNSASIWLERPDGSAARLLSYNSATVVPNSAFRFVTQ